MRQALRELLVSPLPAFLLLGLALLWLHEPWRDEAQPWVLARDAPNVFSEMDSEGSPALWYVLLWPLAKIGLPFVSARLLHVGLASCALAAIALWSPFTKTEQWLLAGSYLFAYEYLALARGYVLTILALVALGAHHARRRDHPWAHGALLLLLANTTGLGTALAGALALGMAGEAAWERAPRRALALAAPAAAGLALAAWQMWPAPDLAWWRTYSVHDYRWTSVVDVGRALAHAFVPIGAWTGWQWNHAWFDERVSDPQLVGIGALLWLVATAPLVRRPRALALWVLSSAALCALYYTRSGVAGQMRHHGMLVVAWIYCVWVARLEAPAMPGRRRVAAATIAALLALQLVGAAAALHGEAERTFSAGPAVASMLEAKGYVGPRTLVGVYPDFIAPSILAPMGADMPRALFLQTAEMGSYVRWTAHDLDTFNAPGHVEDKLIAAARNGTYDHVVLVMSVPSSDDGHGWTRLAQVDAIAPGDGFFVYEMDASLMSMR